MLSVYGERDRICFELLQWLVLSTRTLEVEQPYTEIKIRSTITRPPRMEQKDSITLVRRVTRLAIFHLRRVEYHEDTAKSLCDLSTAGQHAIFVFACLFAES